MQTRFDFRHLADWLSVALILVLDALLISAFFASLR